MNTDEHGWILGWIRENGAVGRCPEMGLGSFGNF